MQTIAEKTVAELVTNDYRTADVFKKFGIDFCCGGKVTVQEICTKKNISYKDLTEQLEKIEAAPDHCATNFNQWEADALVDHIVQKHHNYVAENLELIRQYADKVAVVHGAHHPEVQQIAELYNKVADELALHMEKEEVILFPYIKLLAEARRSYACVTPPHFGKIDNPIAMMEAEHDSAGDHFREIAILSNNYTAPADACNTYRVLYAKLKEFEDDLHTHVHLENNILFPKAKALEEAKPSSCSL
jgi:regulator of cell morphogenesis and NO signaling